MRNRRRVANGDYSNSCIRNRANSRLPATTWSLNADLALLHARFVRLLGSFVSGLLSSERCPLARPAKPARACRRLRDQITFQIGNRNHGVVERGGDVRNTSRHVLFLFLTKNFFLSSSSFCHTTSGVGCRCRALSGTRHLK